MPRIRTIALAVVRRGGDLLVSTGRDPVTARTFYRPLGGGIEFGETGADALRREMREELAVEIDGVEQIGVLENIFTYAGRPGHEIALVFTADLRDRSLYDRDVVGVVLDEGSPVGWQPCASFRDGTERLYPDGLLDLVARHGNGRPPLRGA